MARLPQIVTRGAPDFAGAPPEAFGSGVAEVAQARQARAASEALGAMYEAEQQGIQAASLAAVAADLDEAERSAIQQEDHEQWEPSFEKGRADILKRRAQGLRGDYALEYEARANELATRYRSQLRDKVQSKRVDIARGHRLEAYSALMSRAKDAESDEVRDGLVAEADRILERRVPLPNGESFEVFDGEERARLRVQHDEAIRESDRRRDSESIAAEIATTEADPRKRLDLARERIGGDTRLLDATVARLKDRSAEEEASRDRAREGQMSSLVARAYDGTLSHAELSNLGTALHPADRSSLEAILDREKRARKKDENRYFELREILADPRRRAEASKVDLYRETPNLTNAEFKELEKLKAEPNAQQALIDRKVGRWAKSYLQKATQAKPAEVKRQLDFRRSVDEAIKLEQARLGRYQLSNEEIDAAARAQLRDFVAPWFGGLLSTRARRFEIDVPPADAERIRGMFAAGGIPTPTVEEIREAYMDEQGFEPDVETEPELEP